jgi:acyl carrier protein
MDVVDPDLPIASLLARDGPDSCARIAFVMAVEEEFDLSLTDNDVQEMERLIATSTPRALALFIDEKSGQD